MQRNHTHTDKPEYSSYLSLKISAAALATFFSHPFRVCLNEAAVKSTIVETVESSSKIMFKNAPLNIMRGAMGTGLQSVAKHYAHLMFGHDSLGHIAGVAGATLTGTLNATLVETAFMRRQAIQAMNAQGAGYSLWRISPPIIACFLARETGFCINVFGAAEAPWYIRLPVLLTGALLTAIPHKLVYIEATKDIRDIAHVVPDYRIGFRAVFRNIAYGGVYDQSILGVLYDRPTNNRQLALNFLQAACGRNMYFFRVVFLAVFGELLAETNRYLPKVAQQFGLFQPAPPVEKREAARKLPLPHYPKY